MHAGQNPRPLQQKLTRRVSAHPPPRSRAKPRHRSPQSRQTSSRSALRDDDCGAPQRGSRWAGPAKAWTRAPRGRAAAPRGRDDSRALVNAFTASRERASGMGSQARGPLAVVSRRKKEIAEAFYDIEHALARLREKEMLAVLSRRSQWGRRGP